MHNFPITDVSIYKSLQLAVHWSVCSVWAAQVMGKLVLLEIKKVFSNDKRLAIEVGIVTPYTETFYLLFCNNKNKEEEEEEEKEEEEEE